MTKRKTDEKFRQEVYDLVDNEYIFLDKYVNALTKLRVKHNECGNIYEVQPSNFLSGKRCPYCAGLVKKTDKQFKQEIYDLVGDEYTFLDYYVNNRTKLRVRHNECGNTYKVSPGKFLSGRRCPYCSIKDKIKTDEQFRKEVYELVNNEYVFLEQYQGSMTKIKVKHRECGNTYEVTPDGFLRGRRCPFCFVNHKKTDEELRKEVYDLVGNEYVFLEPYVNSQTKIKVKHNKCGNIYEVKPNDFFQGERCPYCTSTPKGELIILKILDNLGINYEYQKTFNDLKDKSFLSYDFYIPDQNILIEYQGLQHYQPIDYFGGDDRFTVQQKHDQIKLDYAKEHGYNLIAVPYTVDTLSKIKKYLIKHGLKK